MSIRNGKWVRRTLLLAIVLATAGVNSARSDEREPILLSAEEYEAKVYASWIGQIIGNIYGLPHENQHVDKPGADRFPYGYEIEDPDPDDFEHGYGSRLPHVRRVDGAFSDDDTDIEYMYLLAMEKYGPEPTYAQLAESWVHHVRSRVWLANRAALGLMHFGYQPPVTGMRAYNPHWFQIDPQLVNEIWAVTAPGMIDYAVQKSDWAARVTNDEWGVEPTMFYGALYAAAFFESDARRLIEIAIDAMPEGSYFVQTVNEMKRLHSEYPDDWQAAWYEMARIYYLEDEPDTRTIWNANLNGAAGILALLYGENDFQRTLDLACALGFDADNQAATMAGLMGLALGLDGIPHNLLFPVEGWTEPFNDRYVNETRHDMPDASLKDMARRMAKQGEAIILKHGGTIVERDGKSYYQINPGARFTPPLELPDGPIPYLEVGRPADVDLFVSGGTEPLQWEVTSGALPDGMALTDGRLTGTPVEPGVQRVGIRVRSGDRTAEDDYPFVVRPTNLAPAASEVLAAVPSTNVAVRDSMWLTVGSSLYASSVDVIRDGRKLGNGSTFYSIDGSSQPRRDYYGYAWDEPQTIGLVGFHTGAMEENGGWFTSLDVEYRDASGAWQSVDDLTATPGLIPGNRPYDKPHFVEYLLAFSPVTTTAIRIIGDAGGGEHWYSGTHYFTSITELTVHGELPGRHLLVARMLPQNWWEAASAMVRVHLRDWGGNPIWGTTEFQEEAEQVVRFWMNSGIDGMIIDAVNWYVDYTGEIGRERLTDVMASYGNADMQPEGAGGFHEDPVPWITEGRWNSVQDYGPGIWWEEGTIVVANAIETGDPRPIERALRDYHDRVVAAGGVNYFEPPEYQDEASERLSIAAIAFAGNLPYVSHERALLADDDVRWILQTKAAHPALHNSSTRRVLPTDADDRYYAFLQTASDASERMLVDRSIHFSIDLPAFGYRLFTVHS